MRVSLSIAAAALFVGGATANPGKPNAFPFATPSVQDVFTGTRFDQIAEQLKDPKVDGVPLLTEALQRCGFVIWNEDRTKLQDPLDNAKLNLAITDAEIRGYLELYRRGDRVSMASLADSFEPIYKELGGTGKVLNYLGNVYEGLMFVNNRTHRNLSNFLQAMGRTHDEIKDAPLSFESQLDPIQALIFVRIISEELRFAIKKTTKPTLLASIKPTLQAQEAPGWAEDAFAGGVTGLVGEFLEGATENTKALNNKIGKANALMSFSKFLMTYKFLKGTISVVEPGQPLVRTKDTSAGSRRTVVAKFFIDGTGVTDWMKDNRRMINLLGLDPDMPKTGVLKGAEVSWDIKQNNKYASKQLIQAVTGTGDLSKQRTNDAGESRVTFEGKPQPKKLDPNKAMPVDKEVPMVISPQVKNVEMQQDLVDAVTGAIGLKDGPSGLAGPIMEMLYRSKWESPTPFTLKVKDWTEGLIIGQCSVEVVGTGHFYTKDASYQHSINRKLVFSDYEVVSLGGADIPGLDPEMLKNIPPAMRKQMEEGLKQAMEMNKQRKFQAAAPGSITFTVNDSAFRQVDMSACTEEWDRAKETWKGSYNSDSPTGTIKPEMFSWAVELDTETKIAKLTFSGMTDGRHVVIPMVKGGQPKDEPAMFQPLFGITIDPKYKQNGFEIPLKETPLRDQTGSNFYGVTKVPFKFGPNDRFSGVIFLDYSITRKNPPKK